MKLLMIALLLATLVGCTSKQPPAAANGTSTQTLTSVAANTPQEPEWAATLRDIAFKRDLDYEVVCADETKPSDGFFAAAWPVDSTINGYIEDGAVPYWNANGDTQKEAAINLYTALQNAPNVLPKHKPKAPKTMCPLPIQGGQGWTQKYASVSDHEHH